jgi:hypothetical protein
VLCRHLLQITDAFFSAGTMWSFSARYNRPLCDSSSCASTTRLGNDAAS